MRPKMKTKAVKENAKPKGNNNADLGVESKLEIDVREEERGDDVDDGEASNSEQSVPEAKPSAKSVKRAASSQTDKLVNNAAVVPKKVRRKSKPETIDNMKDHVDNGTIDKLTTATLLHWLKNNAIYCTTRDKKADLIAKVKNHFEKKQ